MGEKVKLQRLAKVPYTGIDPADNGVIQANQGDVVEVSPAKAEQLRSDFPNQWGKLGEVDETLRATVAAEKKKGKRK